MTDILHRLDGGEGGGKKKNSLSVAADWLKVSQGVVDDVAIIQERKRKHRQSETIFDLMSRRHSQKSEV